MRHAALSGLLAITMTIGCASAPPPAPPKPQAEEPIRTQEEIASDQASGGSIADPAQCATKHPPPNCPKPGSNDAFADSTHGRRLPRMVGK